MSAIVGIVVVVVDGSRFAFWCCTVGILLGRSVHPSVLKYSISDFGFIIIP